MTLLCNHPVGNHDRIFNVGFKTSHPELFWEVSLLKTFAKFIRNRPLWSSASVMLKAFT